MKTSASRTHNTYPSHFSSAALAAFTLILATPASQASFHLMQIDEIMGGVEGDTSAQAIELRMRAPGQNFVFSDAGGTFGPAKLVAVDANGANPVTIISFPHDVASGTTGGTIVITTPSFAKYTSAPFLSDFTAVNAIPASYLAAGQLEYEDGPGDVLWSVSFGGANFHGSVPGGSLNGSYGSPFAGALPSSGLGALEFNGSATALSSNNSTDYTVTPGPAAFTNNAGQSVTAVPEPVAPGLLLASALLGSAFTRRRKARTVLSQLDPLPFNARRRGR